LENFEEGRRQRAGGRREESEGTQIPAVFLVEVVDSNSEKN
jgi:hypothetical protein